MKSFHKMVPSFMTMLIPLNITDTARSAIFLYLQLDIDCECRLRANLYNKRDNFIFTIKDDFNFLIVNFPFTYM